MWLSLRAGDTTEAPLGEAKHKNCQKQTGAETKDFLTLYVPLNNQGLSFVSGIVSVCVAQLIE